MALFLMSLSDGYDLFSGGQHVGKIKKKSPGDVQPAQEH